MKKRIPLIRMGGTIGTTLQQGTMATDDSAALALVSLYEQRADALPTEFLNEKNFGVLSENNTVDTWNALLDTLREILGRGERYDGIIITHGTDTLAYTAALLSLMCKGLSLPLFLVSSHRPLLDEAGNPDPHANGVDNFAAAVAAIHAEIPTGVYVPYRNPSDQTMQLHQGEQITQCPPYSDDFTSLPFTHGTKRGGTPLLFTCPALTDCVLKIEPYVGLNYDRINLTGVKAILHGVYHSGTACLDDQQSSASILSLARRCAEEEIPLYLAPAKTSQEKVVYASVPALERFTFHGGNPIRFCYGHTQEWLYAALTVACSAGLTREEFDQLLS